MNQSKKRQRAWGGALFILGALLGMLFYGLLAWGDLEATLFESSQGTREPVESLDCPLVLTRGENATVETRFTNTLERNIRTTLRATISEGSQLLVRREVASLDLAPGESKTYAWSITSDDAVWNRFVFVNLYTYPVYPIPARNSACSTLVVDIPGIPGNVLAVLWMIASAALIVSGFWLYLRGNRSLKGQALNLTNGMVFISLLIVGGTILAIQGKWLASGLILIANLLSSVVVLAYKFTSD